MGKHSKPATGTCPTDLCGEIELTRILSKDSMPSGAVVVSYGVGTDSTAILLELYRREIMPALVLFGDTGAEHPRTYDYIPVMNAWLAAHGMPTVTVVKRATRDGREENLEQDCLRKGTLPSLAFGGRSCSQKFKVAPMDKFCNHHEPCRNTWMMGDKVTKLIGYDAAETHRSVVAEDRKYFYRYPLREWGMTRQDCIAAIATAGLPQPGKSACYFCPAAKKHEVVELMVQYPDLASRAAAMEDNASGSFKVIKGLGRHWSWTDVMNAAQDKIDLGENAQAVGLDLCNCRGCARVKRAR